MNINLVFTFSTINSLQYNDSIWKFVFQSLHMYKVHILQSVQHITSCCQHQYSIFKLPESYWAAVWYSKSQRGISPEGLQGSNIETGNSVMTNYMHNVWMEDARSGSRYAFTIIRIRILKATTIMWMLESSTKSRNLHTEDTLVFSIQMNIFEKFA